jgi:hypothetical protein
MMSDKDDQTQSPANEISALRRAITSQQRQPQQPIFPIYAGPENWKDDQTVAKIQVEADREDVTWICGRIYEDVDRGLIINTSTVTKGEHSVSLDTTIVAAILSPIITKAMNLLISEIQKRINQKKQAEAQAPSRPEQQKQEDRKTASTPERG